MAGIDLPEPIPPREPREKKRPVPKKVRAAIAALAGGQAKTVTDAATLAQISREYLSRSMSLPHVAEYMRTMSARTIGLASARAAAVKVDLLDCESSHVRNDASTFVLGVAGIQPVVRPNVNLNFNGEMPQAGYVIDLTGRSGRIVDVTPDTEK
jgi:hypothetical protein